MSDNTSKGNRKMDSRDSVLEPLLERTEALEEEVQRVTEAMALGAGSNNKAEAEVNETSQLPLPIYIYIRIDL